MLVCRGRNEDLDLMCLTTKWLMALRSIRGWFCIACVVHEEWQSVCPARLDSGNATIQLNVGIGVALVEWERKIHDTSFCFLAMLSFSHPYGLTAVFMDGLNCSMKALPVREEGTVDHQTFIRQHNKCHVLGFLLFFLPTAKTWKRRETLQEEGTLPF